MGGSVVRERFRPVDLGANGSFTTTGEHIAGFLAKVSGTITVTSKTGVVLLDAIPVTAGVYTPIPATVGVGAVVQLASSADGTLFV